MRKVIALVAALAVAAVFSSPALAQTNTGVASVTFQLKLNGQVPGWQNFAVEHYVDGKAVQTPLCTTGTDVGAAGPFCKSGGVYTATVQVPTGAPVAFDFLRQDTRTAPELFLNGTRTFAGAATVDASYNFPGAVPVYPSTTSAATTSATPANAAATDAATTSVASTVPVPATTAPVAATTTPATTAPVAAVATTEQGTSVAPSGETVSTTAPSAASSAGGTTGATSGSEALTVARILPDTGGSPLLALVGGSLLIVIVTGFAIRKRI